MPQTTSVVMSNYNYARFLPEALDSILAQTIPADEIIVVDDGSTDESRRILAEYAVRHPSIRPIFQENAGQARAMNTGVAASAGDVVLFMDSDDTWAPGKIETVLPFLERHGFVQHNLMCGDKLYRSFLVPDDHRSYMFAFGLVDFFVPTSGLCLRRDVVAKVFPLPEAELLRICADAYVTRLALAYSTLYTIPQALGMYRVHGSNNWSNAPTRQQDIAQHIVHLVSETLTDRGEPRIPLERNWLIHGENAVDKETSLAALAQRKDRPGHLLPVTALEGYLLLALRRYDEAIADFRFVADNWTGLDHEYCMVRDIHTTIDICMGKDARPRETGGAAAPAVPCDAASAREVAQAYYHMAVCHVRLRQFEQALEAFAGVLANDPDRVEIHLNRSDSLRYLGRYDEALAEVDLAERKNPGLPNLHETRVKVWRAMLEEGEAGELSHLVESLGGYNVQIQTTSICNGKCVMCPYLDSWHKENPGRMSDAVFERVLSQLAGKKLKKVCVYLENEPLVDPKIFDRIAAIKKRLDFTSLEVSTNASGLDAAAVSRLAELMSDVEHEIWISFHGMDKRTHEGIMGLDFERCLGNVMALLRMAEESPLKVLIRGAGQGVTRELRHDFEFTREQYLAFWEGQFEKHGLRRKPDVTWFRYHDRAGTIRRNAIRLKRPVRSELRGPACPRVDQWLHFLYTGEMILCCMDYHKETVFGNIMDEDLNAILSGPRWKAMRKMALGQSPSPEDFICKRCISPGG